jgi:hypothetical protein
MEWNDHIYPEWQAQESKNSKRLSTKQQEKHWKAEEKWRQSLEAG